MLTRIAKFEFTEEDSSEEEEQLMIQEFNSHVLQDRLSRQCDTLAEIIIRLDESGASSQRARALLSEVLEIAAYTKYSSGGSRSRLSSISKPPTAVRKVVDKVKVLAAGSKKQEARFGGAEKFGLIKSRGSSKVGSESEETELQSSFRKVVLIFDD